MVAKVKGTDGSEKEIKIDPDEVDPSNASYVEMLALSAHLKQQGKIDSPAGGIAERLKKSWIYRHLEY